MKPKQYLTVALVMCPLILSAPLLSSCHECDDITKGIKHADLLVDTYDQIFHDDVGSDPYYEIIYSVVNSIRKIACPEEVDAAGEHENEMPLLYSETDPDLTDPEVIGLKDVEITESTKAGKHYSMNNEIEFAADGYYAFAYALDDEDQVTERSETNNEGEALVGVEGARQKKYAVSHIIHVTSTGNKKALLDSNGKKVYFKRWDVKIKYE